MIVFLQKDNVIYDEMVDKAAPYTVKKGDPKLSQDTFGFYGNDAKTNIDRTTTPEEVIIIYRCRQVEALKKTGTGEAIVHGDRLYFIVADKKVSPNFSGSAGTDFYFCGWAKEDAGANESTVLMNFDGTRHTEAGR